MISTVIRIILSVGLHWVQSTNSIRGASCIKVGGSVYVLGGEVHTDNWKPLKYVYVKKLHELYRLGQNWSGWSTLPIANYASHGLDITATALPERNLLYFTRTDYNDKDGIELEYYDTLSQNSAAKIKLTETENQGSSPVPKIPYGRISLLINDMKSNELILIGSKVKTHNNEVSSTGSISIIDTETNSRESFPADFITDSFYIKALYKGSVYLFGPGIDTDKLPGNDNQDSRNGSTLLIAKFNIPTKTWTYEISTGDIPKFDSSYTYTQQKQLVFLVGKNEGTNGIIFVLNLNFEFPKWVKIHQPYFSGYEYGCLTSFDDNLYHYFGAGNQIPLQKIDLSTWNLDSKFRQSNKLPNLPDDNNSNSNLTPTIWGISGGLLLIIIITIAYFIRRRYQKKLNPPRVNQTAEPRDIPMNPYETGLDCTGITYTAPNLSTSTLNF